MVAYFMFGMVAAFYCFDEARPSTEFPVTALPGTCEICGRIRVQELMSFDLYFCWPKPLETPVPCALIHATL